MKVTAEHAAVMTEAITPLDTEERREAYRTRQIPRADQVQDIDKRYRWDLFTFATVESGELRAIVWGDHPYLDSHFDTALRSIVPALSRRPDMSTMHVTECRCPTPHGQHLHDPADETKSHTRCKPVEVRPITEGEQRS